MSIKSFIKARFKTYSEVKSPETKSYSESFESLKSKLIEAYAPVYDGDVEGFESLKESINEADVDSMKKDLDAEISNWDGDSDPIVQKAVDVSKEVRAKLEEISTYSRKSISDFDTKFFEDLNKYFDEYQISSFGAGGPVLRRIKAKNGKIFEVSTSGDLDKNPSLWTVEDRSQPCKFATRLYKNDEDKVKEEWNKVIEGISTLAEYYDD